MILKNYISTFLVSTTIFLYSCEIKESENNTTFKGFGELIVDTPFEKVSNYKKFKKNGNFYTLEKYEISKEIGVVEFVEVELYKGLIYRVKFCEGPFTNIFYFKINDSTLIGKNTGYDNNIYIDYKYYPTSVEVIEGPAESDPGDDLNQQFSNDFLAFEKNRLNYGEKELKFKKFKKSFTIEKDIKIGHKENNLPLKLRLSDMYELKYESSTINLELEQNQEKIKQLRDSLDKAKYMQDVVK